MRRRDTVGAERHCESGGTVVGWRRGYGRSLADAAADYDTADNGDDDDEKNGAWNGDPEPVLKTNSFSRFHTLFLNLKETIEYFSPEVATRT